MGSYPDTDIDLNIVCIQTLHCYPSSHTVMLDTSKTHVCKDSVMPQMQKFKPIRLHAKQRGKLLP